LPYTLQCSPDRSQRIHSQLSRVWAADAGTGPILARIVETGDVRRGTPAPTGTRSPSSVTSTIRSVPGVRAT